MSSDEIYFDGSRFVSASDAADISGLHRDYIARLARIGKISSRRVGKNWYVEFASLEKYLHDQNETKELRKQELARQRKEEYIAVIPAPVFSDVRVDDLSRSEAVQSEVSTEQAVVTTDPIIESERNDDIAEVLPESKIEESVPALIPTPIAVFPKIVEIDPRCKQVFTSAVSKRPSVGKVLQVAPLYAVSPAVDFVHRASALITAITLVFGVYAYANPDVARPIFAEGKREMMRAGMAFLRAPEMVATVRPADAAFAAAAFGSDLLESSARKFNTAIDAILFGRVFNFIASDRGTVQVSVGAATPTQTVPTSTLRPANSQTTNSQTIVERIQTERVISVAGVTKAYVDQGFASLRSDMYARLFAMENANSTSFINVSNSGGGSRSSGGSSIDLANVTITGGTITGVTISGGSVTANAFSGALPVANGGTATSTAPTYGQLLIGDGAGGYTLVATSSLNIIGAASSPGGLNGAVQFNSGGVFAGENEFSYNSTTNLFSFAFGSTTALSATSLCLSSDCRTAWPNGGDGDFSTSSASYFALQGLAFSTTSANYWEAQQSARSSDDLTNNSIEDLSDVAAITENYGDLFAWNGSTWTDFATSSLAIALSDTTGTLGAARGGTGISSITAAGILLGNYAGNGWMQLSTSTLGLLTTNVAEGGNLYYTDARVQAFVNASTTIPKTYTNNTFTGTNIFARATTTSLGITSLLNCDLKTNADGTVYCGVDATGGGSTFGESWNISFGALTPTTTLGIFVAASSTIGNGTQSGGLTISGGATTTGNAYIGGSLRLGTDLAVTEGGTGISSVPTYGQVLVGNSSGGYTLTATSSLGIASAVWGNISGTLANQTDLQAALDAKLSLLAWYATTTDALDEGTTNLYFTTNRVASVLAGTTTDALAQGSVNRYYSDALVNTFITSSTTIPKTYTANTFTNLQVFTNASSTLFSSSYASSTNLIAGTLAISSSITGAGLGSCNASGEKLLYNSATGRFECGTDAGAGGGITSLRAQYSSTQTGSAQVFATSSDTNIGLTITSVGDTHTFTPTWTGTLAVGRGGTGLGSTPSYGQLLLGNGTGYTLTATSSLGLPTFSDLSNYALASSVFAYPFPSNATTSLLAFNGGLTTTNATSTTFAITGITSSLLKTNASGSVVPAIAGTDYANFAYLFPANATTSTLTFSGGLVSVGSTTINGNATTTGMQGVGSLFINSERFTDLTGAGLTLSSNALTVDNVTAAMLNAEDFGSFTCNGASCTVDNDAIALSTQTTGNYVATLASSGSITVANGSTEGGAATVNLNMGNANTWTALQTFANASTTLISSSYASSTNGFFGNLSVGALNGFVGANNGALYSFATSTLGFLSSYDAFTHPAVGQSATTSLMLFNGGASSTLLSANRAWFGGTATSSFDTSGNLSMGGNLTFGTDNTFSIGANGANRPAMVYVANGVVAGGNVTVGGYLALSAGSLIRDLGGNGNIGLFNSSANDFGLLQFGGVTASFPAIKRNGAGIDFRLASDTAYANINSGLASSTNLFVNTTATTTNLAVTGVTGSLLKTNSLGQVTAAIPGTDYANFAYLFPGNATTSTLTFSGGLVSVGSTTINGNATTTGMFGAGSLFVNNDRVTDLTGAGLTLSSNALTVDNVTAAMLNAEDFGEFTCNGTNCSLDAESQSIEEMSDVAAMTENYGDLLAWNGTTWTDFATSTLGIAIGDTTGTLAISRGGTGATTLSDLITLGTHTTGNFLATLSSSGSITVGNSGSENAAATVNLNMGNANTWTALQTFANASTTLISSSYASTTNLVAGSATIGTLTGILKATNGLVAAAVPGTDYSNFAYLFPTNATTSLLAFNGGLTTTNATSTTFAITGVTSSLLKTNASGSIIPAIAGTDYANFAYLFPANATTSLLAFNGGLTAFASSTIGNGTQSGGLTISGGATTTGNAYFANLLSLGKSNPSSKLTVRQNYGDSGTAPIFTVSSSTAADGSTEDALFEVVRTTTPTSAHTGLTLSGRNTSGHTSYSMLVARDGSGTPHLLFGENINANYRQEFNPNGIEVGPTGYYGFDTGGVAATVNPDTTVFRVSAQTVGIGTWFNGAAGGSGTAIGTLAAERIGLGTTTPFAQFSLVATSTNGVGSPRTLFAIASTTNGTATSTLFSIGNTGTITTALGSGFVGSNGGTLYSFATSTLGFLSSYDAFTHPVAGVSATSSEIWLTGGLLSTGSTTFSGNATTTGMFGAGSLFVNNDRVTDLTGAGLTLSSNALTVDDVTPGMLQAADFGEFTCNGTNCSLDADTVSDSEIDYGTVTLADFTNDASYVTGSGSANRLAYWSGASALSSNANFTFDGTTLTTPDSLISTSGTARLSINDSSSSGTDFRIDVASGAATFTADVGSLLSGEYFAFATNNDEKLRITETGRLGIGTTTPWALLSVNPNGIGTAPAFAIGSSTLNVFSVTSTGIGGVFNFGTPATSTVPNNQRYAWTIATSTTASPLFKIDTTSGSEAVTIGALGSDVYIGDVGSPSDLIFEENSTIKGSGAGKTITLGAGSDIFNVAVNLGIGSTTPGSALSVVGRIFASSTATSTFQGGGINLLTAAGNTGCFAINGTCIGTGSGSLSNYDAWTHPAAGQSATTSLMLFNGAASTTRLSVTDTAYFGGRSTTTIDSTGIINLNGFAALRQNGSNLAYASTTNNGVVIGPGSGAAIFTAAGATHNSIVGSGSGNNASMTGDRNNVLGASALTALTDGSKNQAIGVGALTSLTSGWDNVAVGDDAGYYNSTGSANVYIGQSSGRGNSGQNQDNNVAVGYRTLYGVTSGARNTVLGYQAGYAVTSGSDNIIFGYNNTSGGITSGSNNIIIGQDVQAGITPTASNQLNIGNLLYGTNLGTGATYNSTGKIGIGTSTPLARLHIVDSSAATTTALILSNFTAATSSTMVNLEFRTATSGPDTAVGTTTSRIGSILLQNYNAGKGALAFSVLNSGLLTEAMRIDWNGYVGIGSTTPGRKLSLTDAVSTAQQTIAYDSTRYTDFLTDASGDFTINPSGNDALLTDDNLWVCTGGSCPTGAPAGTGNLIVESRLGIGTTTPNAELGIETQDNTTNFLRIASTTNQNIVVVNANGRVGIGTSTPTQQLSIQNLLYVGAGGATGMGTATSTFQGDIKIIGKLDVSTIDPPYTIDGVKYATYVPSMTGVKEETTATIQLDTYNPKTKKYEAVIAFDELEKESDLWLFYQITTFGEKWKELTVLLTPSFDGQVFYKKDIANNALVISGTEEGEVSMRLTAARFDDAKWPNLRPDQDGDTRGTHVISSKEPQTVAGKEYEKKAVSQTAAAASTSFAGQVISDIATTSIKIATSTLAILASWFDFLK